MGIHFEVMNKEFHIEYVERNAIVFDDSTVKGRYIDISDIDISKIKSGMFVTFHTGFIEEEGEYLQFESVAFAGKQQGVYR